MKKETRVKFEDLPELVQGFMQRLTDPIGAVRLNSTTKWDIVEIAKIFDFTKATDAERLAYCEVRYPKGTKFRNPIEHHSDLIDVSNGEFELTDNNSIAGTGVVQCVYYGKTGKFAEIIEDEVKEPLFKVGDRPKWTPELIKQLPHGTVLECAFYKREFTYKGQELFENPIDDILILYYFSTWNGAFFRATDKGYAKIISLPETKSIKEKLKGTCVLNEKEGMGAEIVELYMDAGFDGYVWLKGNDKDAFYGVIGNNNDISCRKTKEEFERQITLDQLRSIVRGEKEEAKQFVVPIVQKKYSDYVLNWLEEKALFDCSNLTPEQKEYFIYVIMGTLDAVKNLNSESVEFKEGEMVEWRTSQKGDKWRVAEYHGKNRFGLHVVSENTVACCVEEIRKIDADADLKKIADEVMAETTYGIKEGDEGTYIFRPDVKKMLIEAMKRVKK